MSKQSKELDDALSLAESLCTTEQIRDILRKRKGEDHVRISAETKEDLVRRNLRDAIDAKAVALSDVFDLIRAAEENGDQHIFYFRPKVRKLGDILTFEHVARQLWGAGWAKTIGEFPAARLKPNDYVYSDFRTLTPKKPKDWILKVYGHSVVTRSTGKIERRTNNTFWREYVEEQLRSVLLARWNNPDLLEIRVQRNESPRRIEEWLQKTWELLKPAIVPDQFTAFTLTKAMERLILEQEKRESLYTFRDASVVDAIGIHANFQTYAEQGGLFTSIQARDSIKSFIEAKSDCTGLAITWLPTSGGIPSKELRTLLGAKESHEMIVTGHCSSGEVDYVTDQLRFFSKPPS